MLLHKECQTETSSKWKAIEKLQQKLYKLKAVLSTGTTLDVTVLKDNNILTNLYADIPMYD